MGKGEDHEALLSLVFSGILPQKRIVSFLSGTSRAEVIGVGATELAAKLSLGTDKALALSQWMAQASRISGQAARAGARIVSLVDRGYPPLLRETAVPPPLLFYKGSIKGMTSGAIAIVGSRRASLGGQRLASRLAGELASRGLIVVSGLARGIDTAAHRGALEVGGRTVAVLGCGIDVMYPPENEGLARAVCDSGAVVTEFPPGTAPLRQNFPMRNRIISGLSLGTVVVEAAGTSGALITAGYALEQNRSVFAVPGAPGIPGTRGTNSLLKQGAKLVECAEDILEEIEPQLAGHGPSGVYGRGDAALDSAEQTALDLLSDRPAHVDEISRSLGLEAHRTLGLLLALEAKGLARSMPGKFYVREALT